MLAAIRLGTPLDEVPCFLEWILRQRAYLLNDYFWRKTARIARVADNESYTKNGIAIPAERVRHNETFIFMKAQRGTYSTTYLTHGMGGWQELGNFQTSKRAARALPQCPGSSAAIEAADKLQDLCQSFFSRDDRAQDQKSWPSIAARVVLSIP